MKILLVFLGMAALDFIWSRYITANAIGTPAAAANWSLPITALSGFVTVAYVNDPWLLIPACAGAWVGTYAAKWKKKQALVQPVGDPFFDVPPVVFHADGRVVVGGNDVR